jgi:hypothetical protein
LVFTFLLHLDFDVPTIQQANEIAEVIDEAIKSGIIFSIARNIQIFFPVFFRPNFGLKFP